MKKLMVLFILGVVFGIPEFSRGEEKQEEGLAEFTMDEVVVSATKTEEKRKDVPNAVIIMDELDIQESPAKTLGELLANELGIDWRTYGNYGGARQEIRIRGMTSKGTQVFVNGVNINSPSLGKADVGRIPLNSIERIEVVKGSGSLLYGTGAIGGTINIITKRPKRDRMDLKVSGGYGSQGTYLVSAEQGMFVTDEFGYYLTANRHKTNGFRSNSDLTQNDVSLKLVLEKSDALDISLYADYIDRKYGIPGVKPPQGTQAHFIDGVEFYHSESASLLNNGSNDDAHVALRFKGKPAEWLAYNLRGDYTYMENYFYQRYNSDGTGARSWTTNKVFGVEGNIDIKPFKGASVLVGSQYRAYDWENKNVDLDSTGTELPGTKSTTTDDLHTIGTYMEGQYRPSKYVKGLAGIRHERHSQFGTENVPLFGLVLNPFEDTAIKATHGRHFLAPTPNDLFWPKEKYRQGNPDLKPETGWHTDVTLDQGLFDNMLFLTGSYFRWDLDNRIQWTSDPDTYVYSPQNLKGYRADGVEIGMKLGPVYDFTLALDYTYLNAEEEAQEYGRETPTDTKTWNTRRATYSPEHLFRGDLSYASPRT